MYEEIFTILQDECFCHGKCPEDMDRWIKRVGDFIKTVESLL